MKISVKNLELLIVGGTDHEGGAHYGGNQDWYGSPWRRGAGCGPTTVATVTSYMLRSKSGETVEKPDFVAHMNDVWQFVTPTMFGLPKTSQVRARVEKLIAARDFPRSVTELDVPEKPDERPDFARCAEYIAECLTRDVPVAFLCLDNGGQEELDNWHWTTLASLDAETGAAEIIDSGRLFTIDLRRWLVETGNGGGFIAMEM
ncbi:MAG: hypothetical protein LBN00_11075 [Oscillospiraceae bacterium]|jgi:hypothetical protein|nr:hypothetical protein [Oscillospiraceae bacterium]